LDPQPERDGATHLVEDLELHPFEAESLPPPNIPGYQILGVLGEGGMGVVYRAVQLALKRPVALKMVAAGNVTASTRQRFVTEAQTGARLRHPNFVQIYQVGECDGRPFLALELIEGGSLADHLLVHGPLPARDAAQLVAVLAHAMNEAHLQGVIHRDLKPANVLLATCGPTDSGQQSLEQVPKITDFGLAKVRDADLGRTRSGAILGTPVYMAPEQARGAGQGVTPATDVYSLGAILFECLTSRPPFDGS